MALAEVNEDTTSTLKVTFRNPDGEITEITGTLIYRIDCITTGNPIVFRTSIPITNASSHEITLSSSDNALVNQDHSRERRRVTVSARWDTLRMSDHYDYWVVNMRSLD